MAEFSGMYITNSGRDVIAKAITGKVLKFTRCTAGSGLLPDGADFNTLQDLFNPVRDMEILEVEMTGHTGTAKVLVRLTNKELQTGFYLREIGLFAQDQDTGQEILYGYCYSGNTADFMPASDGPDPVYYRFSLTVVVDQAKEVTAIFSDDPLAVTHTQLENRLDAVIIAIQARQDFLQEQIDKLAQASIKNSLEHINYQET